MTSSRPAVIATPEEFTPAATTPTDSNGLIAPVTPAPTQALIVEEPVQTTPTVPVMAPINPNSMAVSIQPTTLVSSTRSRFERLEKKIKSSLGGLNQVKRT